ncbi:MAG: Cof-type HAD-IIB family hydrolase [Psychromonas sp.]
MIKLIALDMDGTLLNNERVISTRNCQAIQDAKRAGIRVVLSSGRPRKGLQPYLEQLGLTSKDDFVISYNGSLVQCVESGEVLYQTYLKGSDVKAAFKVSQQLGLDIHAFSVKQGLITHQNNQWTDLEAQTNDLTANEVDFNTLDDDEPFIKAMMLADEKRLTLAIKKIPDALKRQYNIVRSAPFFLEVLHPACNKGIAVAKLCQLLDISASDVMCVGDAENDHAMLLFAGFSVAMENADTQTKALVDHITSSNNNDGVALVIEEQILQMKSRLISG